MVKQGVKQYEKMLFVQPKLTWTVSVTRVKNRRTAVPRQINPINNLGRMQTPTEENFPGVFAPYRWCTTFIKALTNGKSKRSGQFLPTGTSRRFYNLAEIRFTSAFTGPRKYTWKMILQQQTLLVVWLSERGSVSGTAARRIHHIYHTSYISRMQHS